MNQGNPPVVQPCPLCGGVGTLQTPSGLLNEAFRPASELWTDGHTGKFICNVCSGAGVVSLLRYQEWMAS